MPQLSQNFHSDEFKCKCGCGKADVSPQLILKLQLIRTEVGPLTINSGVRCPAHNAAVGGKPDSEHLRGLGADIACADSRLRWRIIASALRNNVHRVGIHKDFIHIGADLTLPQDVFWLY